MTSKLTRQTPPAGTAERFPDFPPRDDMQNYLHLTRPGHPAALDLHFGKSNGTVVMSEAPLRWTPSQQQGHRIPDLMVAFNADRAGVVQQMGYSMREQGKPPDFVLEIASPTTGQNDYTGKRTDYAAFGIPEYWRFDHTGGRYHDAPLAGDRLVDGEYQRIEIIRTDDKRLWGHSEVLNLDLCWEDGQLRWWDPVQERYLETYDEEVEGRIAERDGRLTAERQRDAAESQRDVAEAQRDTERQARSEAEARILELEEQLRRQQGR